MDGLPAEVLAKIQAQKEKLQKEFEEYAAKQQEAKLSDICSAAGVSREEAGFALGLCHNDELEAINKLATDPAFKLKVEEMANGTDSGPQYSEDDDEDDFDSESDGEGGRRKKRRRRSTRQRTTTKTTTTDSSQPTVKINRPHVEGFNVDGTPRAPTIRLGDALKRLEEIRKAKKATPSPSKATTTSSSTKASSSPARASPSKASSSAKSPSSTTKTKTKSPSSTKKAEAKQATTPTSKRTAAAAKKSSPASAKSATPMSQAKRTTTPRKRKADSEEEPTDAVSASSSEGKTKAVAASPVKKAPATAAASKSDDEYTYEDLKSLEWSDARIKAFLGRKSNPNAYYYRFNDPGEEQRTGAWTEEEHKLFMELIKDGVDYHWGIFSIKTPGRVGYQCSNYYRKLIADGVVKDPNYQVDEKGKLTFTRGVTKRMPRGGASGGGDVAAGSAIQPTITDAEPKKRPTATKKSTKRRRSGSEDSDMEQTGGGYEDSESEDEVDGKREYLLGAMQDAMTLKPMKTPAISPYGHVLDYTTWLRLLKTVPVNTCPFTKQRVTRRDLIKLTKENVDQYRSKIVSVAFDIVPTSTTATTTTTSPSSNMAAEVVEGDLSASPSAVEQHHVLVSSSSMQQQIESNA